ncbi:MAG TPA: hypothetical protein VFG14_16470 [Chthoniobacteraceae bacterium]|nr:hypothetical protein [Chthoniobacteraceae bacterium]
MIDLDERVPIGVKPLEPCPPPVGSKAVKPVLQILSELVESHARVDLRGLQYLKKSPRDIKADHCSQLRCQRFLHDFKVQ